MKTQKEILDKIAQLEEGVKETQHLLNTNDFTDKTKDAMLQTVRDIKDDIKTLEWVLK
jgi:hypothetical protein